MNEDRFAQTDSLPLPGAVEVRTCAQCHAVYTDDATGQRAHVTVFGHRPRTPPAPERQAGQE